jgi:hypothetical protein
MKYLYQEPVITTVSDQEITDDGAVKDLLLSLMKMQHSIFMEYADPEHSDSIKKLENVRITNVGEDTIDIHAFFHTASAKVKGIPFHNIHRIRLLASKQLISQKYKVTRWHMIGLWQR